MKNFYLLLLSILTISFLSCSDDDDEIRPLNLNTNDITIYSQDAGTVSILKGNGGYKAVSSDESIATATVSTENVISIQGKKTGKVTITVTDKESKTAKIEVTLKEDNYRYKVIKTELFSITGDVDEEIQEAIREEAEEDISQFYFTEVDGFYQFLRNKTYNGILDVYQPNTTEPVYTGTFMAGSDVMKMIADEKEYVYNGIKDESSEEKSVEAAKPFGFYDKMILIFNRTEYFKEKYPEAGIQGVAYGQYIQQMADLE